MLVVTVTAGGLLLEGRTHALFTDQPPLPANTFATADCFGRTWYLHNNPTPPTANTASQAVLSTDWNSPTATTLYNYDTDRDGDSGLGVSKGGSGASETDATKMQVWRTAAMGDGGCLVGSVTVTLWAAIKDYSQSVAGEVFVYLRDYNGSSHTEIGNGSVVQANWQGGSGSFVQAATTILGLDYTIPAGNMLEVKVIVGDSSGDTMWFAYDTTAYPTRVASLTSCTGIITNPTGLVATPDNTQVSLDWNDNTDSGLVGYNVYRSTTTGGPYSKINGTVVVPSAYVDTGVSNGTTYYYVVAAVHECGNESGPSGEASATPQDFPPAVPTNLGATPDNAKVDLNWNDNGESDLAGYNVYRSTTQGGPYSKVNGSLVTVSNYTDTGLTNGTTYYYTVTAEDNGTNESGYSNEASATPVDLVPAAPTGLAATPADTQVGLNWNDNGESDLAGYNVYRSTTQGGPYTKINGPLVGVSDYTDTGLTNGTTYYYVVTAEDNAAQESGYSSEVNATPQAVPPAAPSNLGATPDNAKVDLNWDDNGEPDLAGYNVYRSTTLGGPYTKINGPLVGVSNYTDTSVSNGTTYYYVVTAENATLESGYSNEASATPQDLPPAAPTGLAAVRGHTKVDLDWNDNGESDLAGYNVYRSTTQGGPYTKVNGSLVTVSDYTDTGLTNGTTYYYVITAEDNGTNESGYSNEASAIPNCAGRIWYLHNNPTPPVGDTASQANLSLDLAAPTAATLYNYDTDRDSSEGRFIDKGGSGATETDLGKHQAWRTAALTNGGCLVGSVTFNFWAAIKDYGDGKEGEVVVYLRDYNGSSYTEIGNGTEFRADWQSGSGSFVQATITITGLNYTIAAGNMLEVKVIVGGSSGDSMWFAYDTTSYTTNLDDPEG